MTSNSGLPRFYANTKQSDVPHQADRLSLFPTISSFFNNSGPPISEHVGLVPRGNFGNMKEGGANVDLQSDLLWGAPGTARFKGPKQVFPRPYATTPFLGSGNVEGIEDQNKVMFGHSTANRKSIQTVTDKQFPVFQPLIPEKEADIVENNYFVEPFLRGGMASRLISRVRVGLS
jgi:hypothetical protein